MSDRGRYRKVYSRIWRHPGFVGLEASERNLALYLLTGPQGNRLGLFVLSVATAAEDLGATPETIRKRLAKVSTTFGWQFDATARVFFIPSWWRWNPPENENVMKGNLKDLNEIPPCALVDAFARNTGDLPERVLETFVEGLRQRLPKGSVTQEQYQNPDQKQNQKTALRAKNGSDESDSRSRFERLAAITQSVLRSSGSRRSDTEYLVDAVTAHCNNENIRVDRSDVIRAIGNASIRSVS